MSGHSFGELGGEDPYAVLGLMPGAGEDEIRAARRRLLRRYHPDLPGGDLQRTQMITAAAYILLDPVRRSAYRDGVSTTSVVGRDVRVEYRTEPTTDPVPPFRPRRPAATGQSVPANGRPDVQVVWQEAAQEPPGPQESSGASRGWFEVPVRPREESDPVGFPPPEAGPLPDAGPPAAGPLDAGPLREPAVPAFGEAGPAGFGDAVAFGEPAAFREPAFPGPAAFGEPAAFHEPAFPGPAAAPLPVAPVPLLAPPVERPPWSALAIVAALMVVTCTPISLVLGLAALVQIHRTGRRGKALALFGTAVGGLFLVLYLLLVPSTMGSGASHV
jgi:hypothetical protein